MSINVVQTLPEDEWQDFVRDHQDGNIFHTPEMFQVFSKTKGYKPELWAAVKDRRTLALFVPVKITLLNGIMRRFTTRSVSYGSVLFLPTEEGHEGVIRLLERYTREVDGYPLFTELRNLCNLEAIQQILQKHKFIYEDHLNYLINISLSPEAIFEKFGRRTRKNIRRALRQGDVMIKEAKEELQVRACYELLRQTYQNVQVPLADYSLFKAAFEILYPKGMIRFTLAHVQQTPVAASIELLYKDIIYGWFGGVDRAYGSFVPNELLMWDILEWGSKNGYRLYDFGGAGKADEEYGVRDFKAKFGGDLVSFGRNVYVHAPFSLRLSKLGYGISRRFFGTFTTMQKYYNSKQTPAGLAVIPIPPYGQPPDMESKHHLP